MEGLVIKSTGSWFHVSSGDSEYRCRIKGVFRLKGIDATNPLAVGDHVIFDVEQDGTGVIHELKDRKNYIIRKSIKLSKQYHIIASNIDRAYLIATLKNPRTSAGFIDRFLVTAEAYSIPASVIFNKVDMLEGEENDVLDDWFEMYDSLGYSCFRMNATDINSVLHFKETLVPGVYLFSGHSGVGKSTLLNTIKPGLNLKTQNISGTHKKGIHTTTFAEMHRLFDEVFIIDTPGIREFGMFDFAREEISHYFPEMRALFNKCQFDNCLHLNEPNCAVIKAAEEDIIHPSRYYSYLSILQNEDIFR